MIILTDQVNEEKPSHLKTQPHTHAGRVGAALFGLSLYVIFFWFVRYSELHWWKAWPEQFPRLIFSNSDAPIYTLARKCGDSAKPKSEIKWNAAHTTHTAQSGKSKAQEQETFFFFIITHIHFVHCTQFIVAGIACVYDLSMGSRCGRLLIGKSARHLVLVHGVLLSMISQLGYFLAERFV